MESSFIQQTNPSNQNFRNTWIIIAAIIITAFVVGCGIYLWRETVIKEKEIAINDAQKKIDNLQKEIDALQQTKRLMPATLSGPGQDTAGRVLSVVDILIDNVRFNDTTRYSKDIFYSIKKVSRYNLKTPPGVAPIFYIEQQTSSGTQKEEVYVPESKDIIAVLCSVENTGPDDIMFAIDPKIRFIYENTSIALRSNPLLAIRANSSLEHKFLFEIIEGIDKIQLNYGGEFNTPTDILNIDFLNKKYTPVSSSKN